MQRLIAKADGNHILEDIPVEEQDAASAEKAERQARFAIQDNKAAAQDILSSTDWTQIPNCGLTDACVAAFAEYRNAIRQIRMSDQAVVDWPEKPTEEWV